MTIRAIVCVCATLILLACGRRPSPVAVTPPAPLVLLPAGTELFLRIVEPVDASQAAEGKSWAAVVARDVRTTSGDLLVGAGSPLYLGVASAADGLRLTVRSVVARGNAYLSGAHLNASSAPAVTGLEPWGTAATSADVRLSGSRIFVPGQALIVVKLGQQIELR